MSLEELVERCVAGPDDEVRTALMALRDAYNLQPEQAARPSFADLEQALDRCGARAVGSRLARC